MKKVYISGPMTGIKELNHPAFMRAEKILRINNYEVINPVALAQELLSSGVLTHLNEKERYMAFLKHDLSFIPTCDFIYMLKGWEESKRAMKEFQVARICELGVLFEDKTDLSVLELEALR